MESASTSSQIIDDPQTSQPRTIFHLTKEIHENPEETRSSTTSTDARRPADVSDTNTEEEEVILSIHWKAGKLGAAYFDTKTSEMFILNEISEAAPEFNIVKSLYRNVVPIIIITDSHASKHLIETLKTLIIEKNGDLTSNSDVDKTFALKYGLNYIPSKQYNFESFRNRIYQLKLPNEPNNASEHDRELFLNSIVNFNYVQTVLAIGGLLKYLDKNWCRLRVDSSAVPTVLSLNPISLDKIVLMDDESFKALQIFNKLPHPSNFKQGIAGSDKEGLSLFSIFNNCSSKIGAKHLRFILQHPTNNLKTIQRRLNTIAFVNKPGNEEVVKLLQSSLKHIRNVNGIMTRIRSLHATPSEWKSLYNTLYHAVMICEICENYKEVSSLLNALGSRNNDNLFQVANEMNRIIDFEVSDTQEKFTVNVGVDHELDKKKQIITEIGGLLTSIAKLELNKLPENIVECIMVYIPNLGYLLGVKQWSESLTDEDLKIPQLKLIFKNNDYIYYKSIGCEELDGLIGNTYPEILAHESMIMMQLMQFIVRHLHPLMTVVKLCAELDCLISMARICRDNDYNRPELTFEKIIDIKNGRHPLQELCVDSYVPNDTKSVPYESLVTILTGPNSCGKSAYLKQVALIVYMAHIGCYVPAESAKIGLVKYIHTRIHTTEDVSTRMSAFLIDIRQISQAMQTAGGPSLVIVDEFGKGTSEVDGLGLLAASINNFLFYDLNGPHVFIATHFHSITQYLIESPHLKFMTMEYVMQSNRLVFLYKLMDGNADKSFTVEVAEMTGISKAICARAKRILKELNDEATADDALQTHTDQKSLIELLSGMLSSDTEITCDVVDEIRRKYFD